LNFLKTNLLDPSRTIIKEVGDKNWESVYWNPDNYRPDVTTKALNEVYIKLDKEAQKKMAEEFSSSNKASADFTAKVPVFLDAKAKLDLDFSRAGKNSKEENEKFIQEAKNNVEWNGTKFVPKPMILSRLNLAKLRDTQTFQDRNVKVSYRVAFLTVGIQTSMEGKI
jgi:hypothetical protein